MTLFFEEAGGFVAWDGGPLGESLVTYPLTIEYDWTADQLVEIGLYLPASPTPPDFGMRVVSRSVHRISDVVRYVYETEPMPLDEVKAELFARLATRRWEIETGGVTVGGLTVPLDRDTQGRIAQIVAAYDKGFVTGPVLFKLAPGVHVEVDEIAIRAVMEAGAQLIQSCFRREGELAALIVAATGLAALEAIDIQGFWP